MAYRKNWGISLLAGCLALALAGCSGPQEAKAPTPVPIAGTGVATGAGATEYHGVPTDPTTAAVTTDPTETVSTSAPTVPSGVDMTEEEWKDYIKDDPQNARPKEEEAPVVDTIPSAAPPPKPTTTTASSTTTTTASSTTTTTATPGTTATDTPSSAGITSSSASSSVATTTSSSATTTTQAVPDNGWFVKDGKTYYYLNGKPVTGYQTMGGVRYYFDEAGVLSSKVGIDVSYAQGTINWQKVKASGVDFAFIRVGFRGWGTEGNMRLDAFFEKNIQAAAAAGIDCGVYFFTQAVSVEEAKAEAQFVLEAIRPYTLTYPIVIDTEWVTTPPGDVARANGLSQSVRTDVVNAFCDEIKANGYYPMIYADKNWLTNRLDSGRLKADVWLAQYNSTVTYTGAYKIWQYTSSHKLDGITANTVDMNVGLFDYAAFIRQNGWNHL